MNCNKAGNLIGRGLQIDEGELAKINTLTRREFDADELYCFRVVLCDNEIDRDMEQFDAKTLEQLAELFIGKTGICDHEAKSQNQQARIFDAEVEVSSGQVNSVGEPYRALVAKAYMVRTESNRDLILEIEAGIKKEVSVGCNVRQKICSVCGKNHNLIECNHIPGEESGGKLCYTILKDALDAYEWSFVAVPAQRTAGIIKSASTEPTIDFRDVIHKLWKASQRENGIWLNQEETQQLQGRVQNLLEDCEQVRRAARRDVMQEVFCTGKVDERTNRDMAKVLDELSVAQMKTLQRVLHHGGAELMPPQFTQQNNSDPCESSDRRFII